MKKFYVSPSVDVIGLEIEDNMLTTSPSVSVNGQEVTVTPGNAAEVGGNGEAFEMDARRGAADQDFGSLW